MTLHLTVVLPKAKALPEAGEQVTGRLAGLRGLASVAVGPVQVTVVLTPVALTRRGPGTLVRTGGVVSTVHSNNAAAAGGQQVKGVHHMVAGKVVASHLVRA